MKFVPGQSGNPSGRPKQDPDLKRLRTLTKEKFKEVAEILLDGTKEEIRQLKEAPETPMLTEWIIGVIEKSKDRGDMHALNSLLDRLVGKVKEELEITTLEPVVIRRPDGRGTTELTMKEGEDEEPKDP